MSALHKSVLIVNSGGIPVDTTTVQDAISDVYTGSKRAMKIEYWKDENGQYDFSKCVELLPLNFADWSQLGPREFDEFSIKSAKMEIRVPTVVSAPNFHNLNIKTFKPTRKTMFEHYKGVDYWTGKQIPYGKTTKDHVKAKSKKGGNGWDNLAITSSEINLLKGDMSAEEFTKKYGYKPHYQLSEPKPVTAQSLLKILNQDWALFIEKNNRNS